MNVIRFLSLCAVVGVLVLLMGTVEFTLKPRPALAAASVLSAPTGLPFGAFVLAIEPCNTGFLLTVFPTGPTYYPFLMWTPASFGFLYNLKAPPVPGQWITGRAVGFLPCLVGNVPIGGGPAIFFYGSGLPVPGGGSSGNANPGV